MGDGDESRDTDYFKNLTVNLRATGPCTVLIAWVMSMAALGIFGEGLLATQAMAVLSFLGVVILVTLGNKI